MSTNKNYQLGMTILDKYSDVTSITYDYTNFGYILVTVNFNQPLLCEHFHVEDIEDLLDLGWYLALLDDTVNYTYSTRFIYEPNN